MNKSKYYEVITSLITPFKENSEIDSEKISNKIKEVLIEIEFLKEI